MPNKYLIIRDEKVKGFVPTCIGSTVEYPNQEYLRKVIRAYPDHLIRVFKAVGQRRCSYLCPPHLNRCDLDTNKHGGCHEGDCRCELCPTRIDKGAGNDQPETPECIHSPTGHPYGHPIFPCAWPTCPRGEASNTWVVAAAHPGISAGTRYERMIHQEGTHVYYSWSRTTSP